MQAAGNGDYSSDNLGSNHFLNFRVLSEIRDKASSGGALLM